MDSLPRPHLAAFQLDTLARRIGTATRLAQKQLGKQMDKATLGAHFGELLAQCDHITASLRWSASSLTYPQPQVACEMEQPADDVASDFLHSDEPWTAEVLASSGSCGTDQRVGDPVLHSSHLTATGTFNPDLQEKIDQLVDDRLMCARPHIRNELIGALGLQVEHVAPDEKLRRNVAVHPRGPAALSLISSLDQRELKWAQKSERMGIPRQLRALTARIEALEMRAVADGPSAQRTQEGTLPAFSNSSNGNPVQTLDALEGTVQCDGIPGVGRTASHAAQPSDKVAHWSDVTLAGESGGIGPSATTFNERFAQALRNVAGGSARACEKSCKTGIIDTTPTDSEHIGDSAALPRASSGDKTSAADVMEGSGIDDHCGNIASSHSNSDVGGADTTGSNQAGGQINSNPKLQAFLRSISYSYVAT